MAWSNSKIFQDLTADLTALNRTHRHLFAPHPQRNPDKLHWCMVCGKPWSDLTHEGWQERLLVSPQSRYSALSQPKMPKRARSGTSSSGPH